MIVSKASNQSRMENKKAPQKNESDAVEEWMNAFDLAEDEIHEQRQNLREFVHLDDLYLDVQSPPFPHSCEEDILSLVGINSNDMEVTEPSKTSFSEPFHVLRKYSRWRCLRDCKDGNTTTPRASCSIAKTIKLAAGNSVHSLSELNNEDSSDVRLVQNLMSCATSVAEKQHGRAKKFLEACGETSSPTGSPLQRLAFYFSEALSVKIGLENTKHETNEENKKKQKNTVFRHLEPTKCVNSIPAYYKEFPVTQITNLVGSHTILRYLGNARRIHAVDLEIRSGVQWVQFMQDVAAGRGENPVHHVRITAVASASKRLIIEETGRELGRFADSVNLRFSFGVVLVEDVLELDRDLFGLNADESVVVYASYTLVTLVGRAERLDHVMEVIRSLSPCIMLVTEMEANCNAPSFIERFVESLFLFGAFFDSLSDCLEGEETSRADIESTLFRSSINNVLAAEEEKRMLRHVPLHVWRACFDSFGMVETELSFSSLDQANLLLRECSNGSSITMCRNGGCLIVGWKGTALTSLSAWKVRNH